jgi:hypothetical protein
MAVQRFERREGGKLEVFISYSRDDLDLADQLDIALRLLGFATSLDRQSISGAEEWRQRLANLIRATRSFSCCRRRRPIPTSVSGRSKKPRACASA